ncbi:unnamed protein product [Owenia fusiformis]|uniref:arylamine N-acetyltransferase n=1 Tax=Owenia fusiformis TaxID=6347 RepID=A0A8S4NU54_OWEFU|nr:unnamed protein product [Owenia fusiformis]
MDVPKLTRVETESFLTDVLQIKNWNEQLQKDREEFLNILMVVYQQNEPFQTLSFMSEDFEIRRIPNWTEIKTAIFTKEGGLCHTLNTFLWTLLKSLGYDVYLVMANVVIGEKHLKKTLNHTVVIVRDLATKGSLHVVDCGFGQPMFKAALIKDNTKDQDNINDFNHQGSGEIYKYVRKDEDTYVRYHMSCNKKEKIDASADDWRLSYWFNIQPNDFTDFYGNSVMNVYFGDRSPLEKISSFHYTILLMRLDGERDIMIKNQKFSNENDEHIMEAIDIPVDELSDNIIKHFPYFKDKEDMMKKAFENMEKIKKKLSVKSF